MCSFSVRWKYRRMAAPGNQSSFFSAASVANSIETATGKNSDGHAQLTEAAPRQLVTWSNGQATLKQVQMHLPLWKVQTFPNVYILSKMYWAKQHLYERMKTENWRLFVN